MKFPLGGVYITPGALSALSSEKVRDALRRHANGDWGELDEHDRKANDQALQDGARLLSAYTDINGIKFWIITEWDRSATTILLPEEY
jgi:hypothetical protein